MRGIILLLVLTMFAVGAARVAIADTYRCEPEQGYVCGVEGCSTAAPSVWAVVDMDSGVYMRCDKKGCDSYDGVLSNSGIYTNVLIAPGAIAKIENPSLEYVEVVSSGLGVNISYGQCVNN